MNKHCKPIKKMILSVESGLTEIHISIYPSQTWQILWEHDNRICITYKLTTLYITLDDFNKFFKYWNGEDTWD